MKEKIYTIPVNEAYDSDCECPMCLLEKNLEREALDYTLGAAMMEEDFRANSDKRGFCNRHFSMLFARQNKLPLALILDTHMQETRKTISALKKSSKGFDASKGGLFRKKDSAGLAEKVSSELGSLLEACIVCDKLNGTMERYADVLLYMWANDEDFRVKYDRSKGLCLKHMHFLAAAAPKSLKSSQAGEFIADMLQKAESELERIQDDIHRFTRKFDYRNKDMEWGGAKDAPIRTIEKLAGYCNE